MLDVLNAPSCSELIIFPDENDSDCGYQRIHVDNVKLEEELLVERQETLRLDALNGFKRKSGLFSLCKMPWCDPLRRFGGTKTCLKCHRILQMEFHDLCLMWKRNELFEIFMDYVYFNAILVFDNSAESRFQRENPSHPYLLNFRRLREFNARMVENIAELTQLPPRIKTMAHNYSNMCTSRSGNLSCDLCGDSFHIASHLPPKCIIHILSGRRYQLSTMKYLERAMGEPRECRVCLCSRHSTVFRIYFYLTHMQWLVYWNCHYRIHVALARSGERTLSSEELIDKVEPYIFKNLTLFFMKFYKHIDYYSVHFKTLNQQIDQWKRAWLYQKLMG